MHFFELMAFTSCSLNSSTFDILLHSSALLLMANPLNLVFVTLYLEIGLMQSLMNALKELVYEQTLFLQGVCFYHVLSYFCHGLSRDCENILTENESSEFLLQKSSKFLIYSMYF